MPQDRTNLYKPAMLAAITTLARAYTTAREDGAMFPLPMLEALTALFREAYAYEHGVYPPAPPTTVYRITPAETPPGIPGAVTYPEKRRYGDGGGDE